MAPGAGSSSSARRGRRVAAAEPPRRALRMRASSPMYYTSDDEDLPEIVLTPPAPAPPRTGTRSLRMHASPPDYGRRRTNRPRRVARTRSPPVVQEAEREPPAPQQPAAVVVERVFYMVDSPPDVITATGEGPGGRTVAGFRCRRLTSTRTLVDGEDAAARAAAISGARALVMCSCHGAPFTHAEFLLHAGGTDLGRNVTGYPWLGDEMELTPPGAGGPHL
ncbi:hypothetical protein OsI_04931 [Oryza sativa Indica Group]|uniref:Ninja-family protein n=1 Tax=Oryza sativa subsp. indica TaxID=39946 RepID=A2WYC7_ORYSI|nr:hypothetical protein OsI_04931 [Oryza sativa Indica Group]